MTLHRPTPHRQLLRRMFDAAVSAAHPDRCLPPLLPPCPAGRLIVLAAGKAAGAMAEAAERHYLGGDGVPAQRLTGIAVTRHGHGRPTRRIALAEAGHPIPDAAGIEATRRVLALAANARADDLVLALISGGASANWIAPAPGVTLADKQGLTRDLLRCGASIHEINTVRKHLSRIKGGRLAALAAAAPVHTVAISDVAGDDPEVIGSGPTVPDPTSLDGARAVLARCGIAPPAAVAAALRDPTNETPKPGSGVFSRTSYVLAARAADAIAAGAGVARIEGWETLLLGTQLQGEARVVAQDHARIARDLASQRRRAILISGGELTVTVQGHGRGGPNQEYLLALALALEGQTGVTALAADTDGSDGGDGNPGDPAGAVIDATTLPRARALGLDPADHLNDNNSSHFFAIVGDLLTTGPTYTNVNDFRAVLVDCS